MEDGGGVVAEADVVVEFIGDVEGADAVGALVFGEAGFRHVPDGVDGVVDFECSADGAGEEFGHVVVCGFEGPVEDGEALAVGVVLFECGEVASGGVGFEAVAVDEDGVGGGDFRGVVGPSEGDADVEGEFGGAEVAGEEFAAGGVFVFAGAVAGGAGDEEDGFGGGGGGEGAGEGEVEGAGEGEGRERFHFRVWLSVGEENPGVMKNFG